MSSGIVKSPVRDADRIHRPAIVAPEMPEITPTVDADPVAAQRQREAEDEAKARALAAELDGLRERARQDGLAMGREQAAAEARASVSTLLDQLTQVMASMQQAFERERAQAQTLVADLTFVAVNRLLGESLRDRQVVLASVKATLESCGAWQDLTVELHPADVPVLEAARDSLPRAPLREIRLVPSPAVTLGGCRVTGVSGMVDARLETQLADLHLALQEARQPRPETSTR